MSDIRFRLLPPYMGAGEDDHSSISHVLRRVESNHRNSAYETELEPLQSTPQCHISIIQKSCQTNKTDKFFEPEARFELACRKNAIRITKPMESAAVPLRQSEPVIGFEPMTCGLESISSLLSASIPGNTLLRRSNQTELHWL